MASNFLKIHLQPFIATNQSTPIRPSKSSFPFSPFPSNHRPHHSHFHPKWAKFHPAILHRCRLPSLLLHSSLSASTPPVSKGEAISQAKICLSTTLEKPLNNLKLTGKLKKAKQPRFRVEIPVIDDSPASLSQLAFEVFSDIPIRRKGTPVKVLVLWPNPTLADAAIKTFESHSSNQIEHIAIPSVTSADITILNSGDVAVFLAPESSQLATIKTVSDSLFPKPVVIFNPRWTFEDETNFGVLSGFVGSFDVIYSFMGLEVKGLLSKRKGVVFKCVRDGIVSGERWNVLVEEEGELKVVSKFKSRPSISEVENVLYNLTAINSPVTKSAKFLRDLVSNVTGKKRGGKNQE